MQKLTFYLLFAFFGVCIISCSSRPSKVEQMRREKAQQDSIQYANAKQNLHYSDSLLQVLIPQVDPLLKAFVYSKNDKVQDHGYYVHRSLQTTNNTTRNFLQAYVSDHRLTSIQSYYFGTQPHHQHGLCIQVGDNYIAHDGSNHAFQAEGWHEILTIEGDNAIQMLSFISNHANERIQVRSLGDLSVMYYLSSNEIQALEQTYQLAILMRDIDALERAIHVANLQIQKYEKKHANKE